MPSPLLELFPAKNKLVTEAGYMAAPWLEWMELILVARLQDTAEALTSVSLANQAASIGNTPIIPSPAGGIYRVSVVARVVQAATTSSGLQVSITATDGAVPITQSTANATGNTTATILAQSFVVRSDAGAPIGYTVTYASVGGTPMLYDLTVVVEQVL